MSSFELAASMGAGGELTSAWAEARSTRPDGVVVRTCLVASVAGPGDQVARRDLACRDQGSPGRVRLLATPAGGTLAAWQVVPDFLTSRLRAGVEVYARPAGSSEWSPPRLAVADSAGYNDLEALARIRGGRALLGVDLSQALRRRDDGRVRIVLLGDDGSPLRRLAGPATPGRPPFSDQRLFATADGVLLAWQLPAYPYRSRVSVLTIP